MELNQLYAGFTVERIEYIEELNVTAYVMKHLKSGARLFYMDAEDDNKVFSISFRTPPQDSTGVAHILEHSVLCGSRKFPLKEPFVELVKGSLNTFLNAMTYPDKTMYPIASKNDKDFANLMDVYLDAVFYPRVAQDPEIVMQEGWHYELDNKEDELTYKGVVYNEMKGVFSSADSILERHMMERLFTDSTYGVESGGDPDFITDLTYEGFLAFYKRFYHPSNSYIFLYGNMDIEERLAFLDREYLSAFDEIDPNSTISLQQPLQEAVVAEFPYSISSEESEEGKTLHALTYVLEEGDGEKRLAFDVLTHALFSSPAAPIKNKLIAEGVGKDISAQHMDSILQPLLSISVNGSERKEQARLQALVESELAAMVEKGFDKSLLEASLNYIEFALREADFGGRPTGLIYNIRLMNFWLYDKDPIEALRYEEVLKALREGLKGDYFEKLVKEQILNNSHKALVSLYPQKGLAEEKEAEEQEKLRQIKAAMSDDELEAIVKQTKALKQRQGEPDSEEALATIPLLELEDLTTAVEPIERRELSVEGTTLHFVPTFTKGIHYMTHYFDLEGLEEEELFYSQLLFAMLGRIETEHYGYEALAQEIMTHMGGFDASITPIATFGKEQDYRLLGVIRGKALATKTSTMLDLLTEILMTSRYTNLVRIKEIIDEFIALWNMEAFRLGHTLVSQRLLAQVSTIDKLKDLAGLRTIEFLMDLCKHWEARKMEVPGKLEAVAHKIFGRNNVETLLVAKAGEEEEFISLFGNKLNAWPLVEMDKKALSLTGSYENEGILTSGKVQYVAKGGNYVDHGFTYTGAFHVLETILRYEYLWLRIRVQGGAYGAFATFTRQGNMLFCSYRDPNLEETLEVYDEMAEYLKKFTISDREMRKYIIGTMSQLDTPMTASLRGGKAMSLYFSGLTEEDEVKRKEDVIQCTQETIRALGEAVEAVMKDNRICVMGNEGKVRAAQQHFANIRSLPN